MDAEEINETTDIANEPHNNSGKDEDGFTVVNNKRSNRRANRPPGSAAPSEQSCTPAFNDRSRSKPKPPRFPEVRIQSAPSLPSRHPAFLISPNDNFPTTYAVVMAIEAEFPHLQFSTTVRNDLTTTITPLDDLGLNALLTLDSINGKAVNIRKLDPDLATHKAVLMKYPINFPIEPVLNHIQVENATRCEVKGEPTRQIIVTLRGPIPQTLQLGSWGTFYLRPYTPEPLRCFNCQRYGHHQSRCNRATTCAICSGKHATQQCLDKFKAKQPVTAKCPNCQKSHHAWNKSCPARKERVQRGIEREITWVQEKLALYPAPPGTFTWGQPKPITAPVSTPTLMQADFPPLPTTTQTPQSFSHPKPRPSTQQNAASAPPPLQPPTPMTRSSSTQTEPEAASQTQEQAPTPPTALMTINKESLVTLGRMIATSIVEQLSQQLGYPLNPAPIRNILNQTIEEWAADPTTIKSPSATLPPILSTTQPETPASNPNQTTPHKGHTQHQFKHPSQPHPKRTSKEHKTRSRSRSSSNRHQDQATNPLQESYTPRSRSPIPKQPQENAGDQIAQNLGITSALTPSHLNYKSSNGTS